MKTILSLTTAIVLASAPAVLAQTDTTKQPAAQTMQKVDTATFVKMVASSNEFEIESSKLATTSATSPDVKKFAEIMINDHTKAGEEFKKALEDVEQTASTSASPMQPKEQQALDALKGATGADFDAKYIAAQTKAHDEAVALFSSYAESGDDAALKRFAVEMLPTLKMHQEHVKELGTEKKS